MGLATTHCRVLAPAATVGSRLALASSYRKLGATAHPYYWLCLTAPPVLRTFEAKHPSLSCRERSEGGIFS